MIHGPTDNNSLISHDFWYKQNPALNLVILTLSVLGHDFVGRKIDVYVKTTYLQHKN